MSTVTRTTTASDPLQDACQIGDITVVRDLLSNNELYSELPDGCALRLAIVFNHKDIVELLLQHPRSTDNILYVGSFMNIQQDIIDVLESNGCVYADVSKNISFNMERLATLPTV